MAPGRASLAHNEPTVVTNELLNSELAVSILMTLSHILSLPDSHVFMFTPQTPSTANLPRGR
jgi:hypothetical protein